MYDRIVDLIPDFAVEEGSDSSEQSSSADFIGDVGEILEPSVEPAMRNFGGGSPKRRLVSLLALMTAVTALMLIGSAGLGVAAIKVRR